MNTGSLQEKILVAKLSRKDKDAFAQLYDFYIDKIYRFIYFKVSNQAVAEDLTSQVFLKIWQHAVEGNIRSGNTFQSLVYTTARHTVIDYYRRNQESQNVQLENAHDIADEKDLAKEFDDKTSLSEIEVKLKSLKSEYAEIIILRYINELSIKEIAAIVNKKKGTVRVTLHRALQALKQ